MKKVHSTLVAVSISLAMALTLSCSDSGGGGGSQDDPSSSSGNSLLLNFTSNYTDGRLRWLNPDSTTLYLNAGYIGFDQDSKVFAHNGKIYVLERPTDTTVTPWRTDGILNCFTPPLTSASSSYATEDLGDGSNPYDIAFDNNGNGYIALYGIDSVQIFNATSCQLNGRIGLPSTIPVQYSSSSVAATTNAASIKTDGTKLYVVMQTWKSYPDTATNGALVRISLTNNYPRDSMLLNYVNPQSSILNNGNLYIASTNDLGTVNNTLSGVEVVNSVGGTSPLTSTPFVPGTTIINGGVTSMALDSAGQLYMAVYQSWGNVPLYSVPISSGSPLTNVSPTNIKEVTCLVYDDDTENLFIGNGTPGSTTVAASSPHLMVYNTSGGGTATSVLNSDSANAYPPYSLAIVRYTP